MSGNYGKSYCGTVDFKEWYYILFKNKKCPFCESKMKYKAQKEYIGIHSAHNSLGYTWKSRTYWMTHAYHCSICNKTFKVSELLKNGKDIKCISDDSHNDNPNCLQSGS